MRKNTQLVLERFIQGKSCNKCEAVWTDGTVIYSYREPIVAPDPDNPGGFLVTNERFSQTMTVQTNGCDFGLSHEYKRQTRRVDHDVLKATVRKVLSS